MLVHGKRGGNGMKDVIELLERAKADLVLLRHKGAWVMPCRIIRAAYQFIDEAIAKMKAPRWIPYKELSDAHDYMSEAIKAIEDVESCSREEKKRIMAAIDRIECAMGAVEKLIPLPLPRWETPEQWEKRTG
jgi:hypothetical protein